MAEVDKLCHLPLSATHIHTYNIVYTDEVCEKGNERSSSSSGNDLYLGFMSSTLFNTAARHHGLVAASKHHGDEE